METFRFFASEHNRNKNADIRQESPGLPDITARPRQALFLLGKIDPAPSPLVCSQLDSITRRNHSNQGGSDGSDNDDDRDGRVGGVGSFV